jgi:poly-gamma-glutamate synthesis protein (capsule biosynthesis protein)
MLENRIYYLEPDIESEARLLFAGDILFDSAYTIAATALQRGGTMDRSFSADLLDLMHSADVMMLNNEFTYTNRGEPTPDKQYTFRAHPDRAAWLNEMGVNIVSLANNHSFDYGEVSLLDTFDALSGQGILYAGAGRNIAEASAPVYFIIGELKIAILAATQIERYDNPNTRGATAELPGVFRFMYNERLLATIAEVKENCDFLVVFVHWGSEGVSDPTPEQQKQAREIAAAGANLIVGAHPHVLQGIAINGETPIAYSLGNFFFSSQTVDTGLLEIVITAEGMKSLRFITALQSNCFTALVHDSEKERSLNVMRDLSPNVEIDDEGIVSW